MGEIHSELEILESTELIQMKSNREEEPGNARSRYDNSGHGLQLINASGTMCTATSGSPQLNRSPIKGNVFFYMIKDSVVTINGSDGATSYREDYFGEKSEEAEDEILQILRNWLVGNHINERYDASIRIRLKRTCDWIFCNSKFEQWRSVSSFSPMLPKLLWINGPPGFGKTVLCARIIERITEQKEIVAHFFFSSDLESHKDPMIAMQSWIYHMALNSKSVASIVNKTRKRGQASPPVIIELFQQAIKMVSNCTLVVDGLDECNPDSSYLSVTKFIKVVNEAVRGTNTRILVMSRTEPNIRRALMEVKSAEFSEYEVGKDDVRSDIENLSRDIVAKKLQDKDVTIQNEMVKIMSDRSEGQFLWLRLQQESMRERMNQEQFQDAIKEIPTGFWKVYRRNLENINNLTPKNRARVISLLRLAIFSLRPLTIREISEAVLVSDEYKDFPVHKLPDQWDEKYLKEKILDLCCSFLEVRKQRPDSPFEEWTIHPVNFSVKNFYLDIILYQNSVLVLDSVSRVAVEHSFLAKLCVTYMNYSYAWQDSQGDVAPCLGSFTDYAARFWNKHVEAGTSQQKTILVEKLLDENSLSWTMWRNWFDSAMGGWANAKSDRDPAIPLCYAIELGFVDVAMYIIKKGEERVNYHSSSRTALGVACSKGYEDLARKLLAHGAKVGIRDAHGRTAVYYAAMNGHLELVKLLIDHGANINIRDSDGVSPFLAASTNGHPNIMRQLIQKGADIHQLDKKGDGALFKASSNGHIDAVRILIVKGVHLQLSNYLTTPPIFVALKSGSSLLARLLIEQEKDLNIKSGIKRSTILHVAIYEGKTDIARLLINLRVNLELQDADGRTPLFVACTYGHTEIVKLLIDKSVKIMTPDKGGETPLYAACANCYLDIAKLLVEHGADVNPPDEMRGAPLSGAALGGSIEIVRLLTNNMKADDVSATILNLAILAASQEGYTEILQLLIEWIGDEIRNLNYKWADTFAECNIRDTALLLASDMGHAEVVEVLLNYDANVGKFGPHGRTALYAACCNGHINVANLLIERDPEAVAIVKEGLMPLMGACANGHLDVVKLLLGKGAALNTLDVDGMSAAYAAASNGHLEVLQLLLSRDADIFRKHKKGLLPLHIASQNGHSKTVDLLIENGSDVTVNEDGKTPLWLASFYGKVDVVNVLLKYGVDVDASGYSGQTSLAIASSKGDVKLAKLLLDNCANISIKDNMGGTPLYCASANGHLDVVRLLLDNGADMTPDNKGQTPAFVASANGHLDVVKLLLDNGADMTPDNKGQTPAYIASTKGHIDVLRLLIGSGADVTTNSWNKEGFCPLYSASANGHVTIVEHLIKEGVDLFKEGNSGWSLITLASSNGHKKTVKFLIEERKTNAEQPDDNGKTPLIAACEAGHVHIARYLLKKDINVNKAEDTNNTTPLLAACSKGHTEVVKLLLQHGADTSIMNQDGMTPAKVAAKHKYIEISKLLSTHYTENIEKSDLKEPVHERKMVDFLTSRLRIILRQA